MLNKPDRRPSRRLVACMLGMIGVALTAAANAPAAVPQKKDQGTVVIVPSAVIGKVAQIALKDDKKLYYGFMIDQNSWKVTAVIVEVGGFLGVGAKCKALEPSLIRIEKGIATAALTLSEIKELPNFNNNDC